jgi:translation elongation factor EF-4
MKKTTAFMLGALLALSLALAACGGKAPAEAPLAPDTTTTIGETPDTMPEAEKSPDVTAPEVPDETRTPTEILEAVIKNSQPSTDSINRGLEGIMQLALSARGSALVHTFTYSKDLDELSGRDNIKTNFTNGLSEQQEATYTALRDTLERMGVTDASVVVEYFEITGELVFSVEYTK